MKMSQRKKSKRLQCKHRFLSQKEYSSCEYIKKNGLSNSGKQKYHCKLCGATICEIGLSNRMKYSEIKQMYALKNRENLSFREIARRLGYSHSTIIENKKYWDEALKVSLIR